MPSPPKFLFPGGIYFVTTSVEDGLMFPPNALIKEIVLKSLAQAQELHYVEVIDIIVQPTHIHLLIRILDPSDAADFMERFKTETAHAINRVCGRTKRTIWCEGYDSPFIPDLATAMDKIVYILTNPSNDNAVDRIEEFPGFNTFSFRAAMAKEGASLDDIELLTHKISRSDFSKVTDHSASGYRRYSQQLIRNKETSKFTISPNALFRKFGITNRDEIQRLSGEILDRIRQKEQENRERRAELGHTVIGAQRLQSIKIGAHFIPHRTGRRMRVHCSDPRKRRTVFKAMRRLQRRSRAVLARWRMGDFSVRYPIGMFPPTGIRLAEPIDW